MCNEIENSLHQRREISFGLLLTLAAPMFPRIAQAQSSDVTKLLEIIKNSQSKTSNNKALSGITGLEADGGIREALLNGAISAILKTGKTDGYWGDNLIRIALPKPFGSLQKNLKYIGASKLLDDLHLKINRAAESAVQGTREIFANTIKTFTIADGIQILRGGEQAGTMLLMDKTKPQLINLFRPNMTKAIDDTGAGLALEKISKKYNSQLNKLGDISQLGKQNGVSTENKDFKAQFIDYSVAKSLDGLFYYIGQEEASIRKNPAKRTSDLLKKVFGAL